jgi:hypothetical protein
MFGFLTKTLRSRSLHGPEIASRRALSYSTAQLTHRLWLTPFQPMTVTGILRLLTDCLTGPACIAGTVPLYDLLVIFKNVKGTKCGVVYEEHGAGSTCQRACSCGLPMSLAMACFTDIVQQL